MWFPTEGTFRKHVEDKHSSCSYQSQCLLVPSYLSYFQWGRWQRWSQLSRWRVLTSDRNLVKTRTAVGPRTLGRNHAARWNTDNHAGVCSAVFPFHFLSPNTSVAISFAIWSHLCKMNCPICLKNRSTIIAKEDRTLSKILNYFWGRSKILCSLLGHEVDPMSKFCLGATSSLPRIPQVPQFTQPTMTDPAVSKWMKGSVPCVSWFWKTWLGLNQSLNPN